MSTTNLPGTASQTPADNSGNTDELKQTLLTLSPLTDQDFAHAYERGFQKTVRFLASRGIERDGALDVAQGAWTKAWERRTQLRNPSFLLTWVNSIALNIYRTGLRREPRTDELPDLPALVSDMDGAAIDAERILSECKPSDRIVLEAHYICGYKLEEIAKQNNWSETAARIRLLRARRKMRLLFVQPRRLHVVRPTNAKNSAQSPDRLQREAA